MSAGVSVVLAQSCLFNRRGRKLALLGLVESAEAFPGNSTAVPRLEMRFIEGESTRTVDLGIFIVFNGVESGLRAL